MTLTDKEKQIYSDWFLNRCYEQEEELLWLLDNISEKTAQNIKIWIDDMTVKK
jgi:hypothetical protein